MIEKRAKLAAAGLEGLESEFEAVPPVRSN
jgi:hypothetical protein